MEPSISPGSLPAKTVVGLQFVTEEKDMVELSLCLGFFFNVISNLIPKRDDFSAQEVIYMF